MLPKAILYTEYVRDTAGEDTNNACNEYAYTPLILTLDFF